MRWLISAAIAGFLCSPPTADLAASPIANPDIEIENALANSPAPLDTPLPPAFLNAFATADFQSRPSGIPTDAAPGPAPDAATGAPRSGPLSSSSLKAVLSSLATRRPAPPRSPRAASGRTPPAFIEADYRGLLALIFDSETVGDALRAVIDIKLSDGQFTTFSVLGMGDFVFEVEGTAQSAMFYELSSGWSMTLVSARDSSGLLADATDPTHPDGYNARSHENVNFAQLVWNWVIETVTSPFGVLATMIIAILIFTWVAYRLISRLQQRTLGSRR